MQTVCGIVVCIHGVFNLLAAGVKLEQGDFTKAFDGILTAMLMAWVAYYLL